MKRLLSSPPFLKRTQGQAYLPDMATVAEQSSPSPGETVVVEDLSNLTLQDTPAATEPPAPHRSHNPEDNLKQSDPFQFGNRLLSEEDNVFEFNAWDHVETDDAYKEYAETQYAKQREAPVSDFDKSTFVLSSSFTSSHCYLMNQI